METLADIGEDELIRRLVRGLKQDASVIAGPGDDCAVVKGSRDLLLLKTDTVVEGVHFTPDTPGRLVGRKAMARVISDFAAMAATPRHALITLIAPPQTAVKRVLEVYAGLRAMAESFGVNIVGGETSTGSQLILTVSMTGTAPNQKWVSRNRARAGDALYVTGRLGGSIRGRHLRFHPRMQEAHWISRHLPVHAMMDISDGLAKDLPRLAAASGLGFSVDLPSLPRSPGCTPEQAWGDGEDYELLLAISARTPRKQLAAWHTAFPKLPLTRIGTLVEKHAAPLATPGGWEHFR
ncbi:thiamine-monophosphate kinase [Prosthecobacter fusiformis]|uniref:Thiamine-monophosphate kinase n=1 Tax=Prosthecobacter fusiformis TaxID=48464 RepID=A0A4R7RLH6_9BACT|nr:thiamine-phosphate kinase [Prosthecobacter fusiformis]TDU62558.1 thiamine-monophosphate kinase [Prosthecobacter fusiformis]